MQPLRNPSRLLGLTVPSLMVAGGLGALEYLRSRVQNQQTFLPDRFPSGVWDPTPYGLAVEDVWFRAGDGVDLHGWWIRHPRAQGTFLFCHGNSGSIAHQVPLFRVLRRLRVNLFAFDYRGYGRSEGVPSERGLFLDVRAAFDHLTADLGQAPETIILFGHSLGGAVAVDGALHRPAAGLIVQSSFTDIKDMARVLFPQAPVHWLTRKQFRSIDKVSRLTLPKLFIHGTDDPTVPLAYGRELYETAAEPKRWYAVPGAGHTELHRPGGLAYLRKLGRFRSSCLRRRGSRAAAAPALARL